MSATVRLAIPVLLTAALAVQASAQSNRRPRDSGVQIWRSTEGRYGRPIHSGLPEIRAGFTFCRLWYDADRRMDSGLGWSTDYPAADGNFLARLEELTLSGSRAGRTATRASPACARPTPSCSSARSYS